MQHSRRARPTLEVIANQLTNGWRDAWPQRAVQEGSFAELHPLSELPHPLIAKAADSFGTDPSSDNSPGLIKSATTLSLHEVRISQWRGGIWCDPDTGVHWLVVAGLAKGNHLDHDDFYEKVKRLDESKSLATLLPSEADKTLLKRETAARLRSDWLLKIQTQVSSALKTALEERKSSFRIAHPVVAEKHFAEVSIEVDREDDIHTVTVSFDFANEFKADSLSWDSTIQVLSAISPPQEGWDVAHGLYFVYAEDGYLSKRVSELAEMSSSRRLAESRPGEFAHFTHSAHIAGATVEGEAVVSMCGYYFVPYRNPDDYNQCPRCREEYERLPK